MSPRPPDCLAINVSPAQGKLLYLLVRLARATRLLEIGTLGGYSTTWLARALEPGGRLISLEVDPKHAAVGPAKTSRAVRPTPTPTSASVLRSKRCGR